MLVYLVQHEIGQGAYLSKIIQLLMLQGGLAFVCSKKLVDVVIDIVRLDHQPIVSTIHIG